MGKLWQGGTHSRNYGSFCCSSWMYASAEIIDCHFVHLNILVFKDSLPGDHPQTTSHLKGGVTSCDGGEDES